MHYRRKASILRFILLFLYLNDSSSRDALFSKLTFMGCLFPCCLFASCLFACCLLALCLFACWLFAWFLFACWLFALCLFAWHLYDSCLFKYFFFLPWSFFTSFDSVYTRFDLTLFTLRLLNFVIDIPSWRHAIGGAGWRTGRHTGWQSSSGRERDSLRHIGQNRVRDTCLYIGRLGAPGADRPTGWKSSRSIFPVTWWYTNWRFRYVFDKTT